MNLICICLDTFRADIIGNKGKLSFVETPNLDALARESVCFDRAFGEADSLLDLLEQEEPKPKFVGRALVKVMVQNPQTGEAAVTTAPLEFKIEAETIEEAFEKFDEHAKTELVKRNQQNKSNIIVPAGMRVPGITSGS